MTSLKERLRDRLKYVLVLVGILLALALPLAFMLENFVRDAIVYPLAYEFWLAKTVLNALPQACGLGVLVALMAYIAMRSLLRSSRSKQRPPRAERKTQGNLSLWLQRLDLVSKSSYSRERLDHHIGQFVLKSIAYEERLTGREMIRRMGTDDLDVPPDVEPYLQAALHTGLARERRPFAWFRSLVARVFHGKHTNPEARIAAIEDEVEPALRYVEKQLRIHPTEVNYDDRPSQ
ncbi:MAG: hypothetical protein ACP5JG_14730 [Anaerolineae bacterium]